MDENEIKQFTIRIDKNLFEQIERLAKQESRDRNKQIEFMLKTYMKIKGEI